MSITDCLLSAAKHLDKEQNRQLSLDVMSVCQHLDNPNFRIAVFGPFNQGKSTLLNALLGNRALPIKLIPTTGTSISIQHGSELKTHIKTFDGSDLWESGTEILERFAVLDGDRYMRKDVVVVEVFCPHPLLKKGVELIDLPGTNDMEEQDTLVFNQLLAVDLVIQVLDARKLFTLKEVENLHKWMFDRGIKTVVFVVNFLNLLEVDEQKEVINRARSIASEFRTGLPSNISNLYRVDALPALRARLHGNVHAEVQTGIRAFESALYDIVEVLSKQIHQVRLPRAMTIAEQVEKSLAFQIQKVRTDLRSDEFAHEFQVAEVRREAERLEQTFKSQIGGFRNWLSLDSLVNRYQSEVVSALRESNFTSWETGVFKNTLVEYQQNILKPVHEASLRFNHSKPQDLSIGFPADPNINLPTRPSGDVGSAGSVAGAATVGAVVGSFLFPGVGTWLGGAIGAAISHNSSEKTKDGWSAYYSRCTQIYNDAAKDYLSRFSSQSLSKLSEYEAKAAHVFSFYPPPKSQKIVNLANQINFLQASLDRLTKARSW